ncbi:MAG: integrin alpha [Myxococcota bacterium]
MVLPEEPRADRAPSRFAAALALREYWATDGGEGLQAPNRAQDLRSYFEATGVRIHARTATESPRLVELRMAGLGRGESMRPVGAGAVTHHEGRIEIARAELGLVEWFVNSEAGLEQGFTLAERPAPDRSAAEAATRGERDRPVREPHVIESPTPSDLVVELAVTGASAGLEGTEVVLATDAGRRLDYGKLAVVDAAGHRLAARFEVPRSDRIRIRVDDRDAAYPIVIDPLLTGVFDTLVESNQASAQLGFSVASAGDVNGDGYDDVIVGAPFFDAGTSDEGAAFILLGSSFGIDQVNPVEASAQIEGNQLNAQFGNAVASAGDVNGDGYDDVVIGSALFNAGQTDEGVAWIYLGSPSGIPDGNPATAHAGFESNQANAQMGFSVASAGDVNGDGYEDVIIGAPFYDNGLVDEGMAFVYHGSAAGFAFGTPVTANTRLESDQIDARFGVSVASAGRVDADAYADVIVGAHTWDGPLLDGGAAFVFRGSASGIPDASPLTAHARITSDQAVTRLGFSVAGAGDVNGDGHADVVVGAFAYDFQPGDSDMGAAFVFTGSAAGLAHGTPATAASQLHPDQAGAQFGRSVASAGDVDGDGLSDVIVGAMLWDDVASDEGAVFVYRGRAGGMGIRPPVFRWAGSGQAGARLGAWVSSAGDVNADGYDDVVAGAPLGKNGPETDEGFALVFRGAASSTSIIESVSGFPGSLQPFALPFGIVVPDTMGAVGLTQFLEFSNGNVSVYDKVTGVLQSRVSDQAFWQQAGVPEAKGIYTLGDQRVIFDAATQRWIASGYGPTTDKTNLAVSATADPLGVWRGVQFAGVAAGEYADRPTLAVDRDGVYVATTRFSAAQTFIRAMLHVIPKADLLGGIPSLARKTDFSLPNAGSLVPFVVQGAVNRGLGGQRGEFLTNNAHSGNLVRFTVDGVGGSSPTLSTLAPVFAGPLQLSSARARQPDGTRLVPTLDDLLTANVVRVGNRIFVVRTVHRTPLGSAVVNWQVIDATTGLLIDEGDLGGGGFDAYQGSIAVNDYGQAVVGYNRSSFQTADVDDDGKPDGRISFLAQAFVTDAGGGLDPAGDPVVLRVSDVDDYRCGSHTLVSNCETRWGEASAVTIDPTDPRVFYAIGETAAPWAIYPGGSSEFSVWQTYIARIRLVPEPGRGAGLVAGLGLMALLAGRRRGIDKSVGFRGETTSTVLSRPGARA